MIELGAVFSTDELAKKFHVHPTTVTRTLKKRARIQEQASRVNGNFKTVQTNLRSEEHDSMVLDFIRTRHEANEAVSIKEICDKAAEYAKTFNRTIKSRRGWWRRFKVRCNIIRSRVQKSSNNDKHYKNSKDHQQLQSGTERRKNGEKTVITDDKRKHYTFRVKAHLSGYQMPTGTKQIPDNNDANSDNNSN